MLVTLDPASAGGSRRPSEARLRGSTSRADQRAPLRRVAHHFYEVMADPLKNQ